MDREKAAKLIEKNLHTIFAWCLARLYDKAEAEDLAQDIIIIYTVLKSAGRLEQEEPFFGISGEQQKIFFGRILEKSGRKTLN